VRVQAPAARETTATATDLPSVASSPSASPASPSVTEAAAARESGSPVLVDLPDLSMEEIDKWWEKDSATQRPARPRRWRAAAAASFVVISASMGLPAWYARASVNTPAIAALLPPSPSRAALQPATVPSPRRLVTSPSEPSGSAAAAGAASAEKRYTILVAAFTNSDRAQAVVRELRDAGYAADAVEVDAGVARGRFVQVKISGYQSAPDVQRALQEVRELPGGFGDARIIESH
jgi:hypothetical protein